MAITNNGAEPVEEQSQQSPMPSENQQVPELTDDSGVGESETFENAEVSSELPEGASERTAREFEKLKKQLREEREKRISLEYSRNTPQPTKQEDEAPLYDEKTGLVNIQALNELQRKAKDADERARKIEFNVQKQTLDVQERELVSAYPQLNPKADDFDEKFFNQTRAYLHDSLAFPESYGGRQLTYKEAADLARGGSSKETPQQEADRLGPKEEASLGASGRPTQGVQTQTSEQRLRDLQVRTRMGDKDAQIARLRAIREANQS